MKVVSKAITQVFDRSYQSLGIKFKEENVLVLEHDIQNKCFYNL